MQRSNGLLGVSLALTFAGLTQSAFAQSEIKIGEINSYSLLPAFTEPYRKGWQLAVEEINAAGGVNGKKLVVISKDDGGKPADAQFKPFCSRRCADVDLHRWFSGVYAVPVTEDEEEDERRDEGGEPAN